METIQNKSELATTPLRRDALAILESGYQAIQTAHVIKNTVSLSGSQLHIAEHTFDLDSYNRVFLFGIGKCALEAAVTLELLLNDHIDDGIVLDVKEGSLKRMKSVAGTHPLPTEKNVETAEQIADMLETTTEDDLVLVIVSGGGSSLLCLPHDLRCEDLGLITDTLMDKGATIDEINTVRKHTSRIQGGQFAQRAHPAEVASLIFSDVPGNDISVVASGPTVQDPTTAEDAERILEKYDVLRVCNLDDCGLVETPKDDMYFSRVHNILVVSNRVALDAMTDTAKELGYEATIVDEAVEGEARELGRQIAREATKSGTCNFYGGETTVTVVDPDGKGGRNQEVALGALSRIMEGAVVVAAASDGWDNSEVAGALVDSAVKDEAVKQSLDPQEYLHTNNSFAFFDAVGGHIRTGRTKSNVADFYFSLTQQ